MMRKLMVLFLAAITAAGVSAAAEAYKSSFAKPQTAALKALKATRGKEFSSGWVFVDGKYIPPPYKVERYGTVIRINGTQVTGEIVPWTEFIKTQDGVEITRNESAPVEEPADDIFDEEEEEEEEEDIFEDEDDEDSSLDDLFDDEPEEKKPAPVKKAKKKRKPRPKKPTVTVSYNFDGEFTPNDKTKEFVKKINDERTKIDKQLRTGGYILCGARYGRTIYGDSRAAKRLLSKLPGIMKDNSSAEAFRAAMSSAGFGIFPPTLIKDFHANRFVYPQLQQRLKEEADKNLFRKSGIRM